MYSLSDKALSKKASMWVFIKMIKLLMKIQTESFSLPIFGSLCCRTRVGRNSWLSFSLLTTGPMAVEPIAYETNGVVFPLLTVGPTTVDVL